MSWLSTAYHFIEGQPRSSGIVCHPGPRGCSGRRDKVAINEAVRFVIAEGKKVIDGSIKLKQRRGVGWPTPKAKHATAGYSIALDLGRQSLRTYT